MFKLKSKLIYLPITILVFSLVLSLNKLWDISPNFNSKQASTASEMLNHQIVTNKIEYPPGATRNKHKQPFAQESIWNLPISLDAKYEPANLEKVYNISPEVNFYIVTQKTDPIVNWYSIKNWGVGRCEKGGEFLGKIPVPQDLIVPDATEKTTPNNAAAFLQPDGRTLISTNPLARCERGGPVFGHRTPRKEDIYGLGITGGQGGSGLSSIGGTIRLGELLPDAPPIPHVLKLLVHGYKYLYDRPPGYRWPAIRADARAFDPDANNRYGGDNPNLVMGALLAIPPNVTIESLELETVPAKKLFYALQDFGGYIVDNSGWNSYSIGVEKGVTEEFKQAYGFSFSGNRKKNSAFYKDINKLFKALSIVTNNRPRKLLNPDNFRQPLAPPIGN
ncbi:MAG: hypothetical protein QNJ37_17890 [Crocosphaera sp.]|nr:hypothetical protein [Crocosphaera sp.]